MREPGRRVRYGGAWFAAASALPIGGGLGRPRSLARLLGAVVARPWRLVALLGLLLRSPTIDVVLSDSPAGAYLQEHFSRRFLRVFPQQRMCRGVLRLPEHEPDYVSGRRRHAVRNNLRRAAAAGIRCEPLEDPAEALRALRQILMHRNATMTDEDRIGLSEVWPSVLARPEVTTWVARSRTGAPLAVSSAVIDDEICVIRLAVASSHAARWTLHHHLVSLLIGRRVRYLLAADGGPFGALGLRPEVQYFQHLLGYAVCHVVSRRDPRPAGTRADRPCPGGGDVTDADRGTRATYRVISQLIDGTRLHATVAVVLALGQAALLLPVALLLRHVFDVDIPRDDGAGIVVSGVLIGGCYCASAALSMASGLYAARATRLAVGLMRRRLVARLELLPLSWHDRHEAGTLHAIVVQDCERADRMVDSLMSQVLPAAISLVALAAVAVVLNAVLSGVMVVVVALMFAGTHRFADFFQHKLAIWHSCSAAFSTHAHAMLDGLRTIRAAGARQQGRFDREIGALTDALYEAAAAGSRYQALQGAVAAVAGVAVIIVGGLLVAHHDLTLGGLLAFYAVIALMLRQLSTALGAAPIMLEGAVAIRRVQALAASAEPGAYAGTRRIDFRGAIELESVTFAYCGAHVPALSDVSVRVAPGEHLCVVGANGAGKTTLIAMMLGLYRPQRGHVRADGVSLADIDLVDLRRQMGVVLQDGVLFAGTIRENLLLGCGEADDAEIGAAVRTAMADEVVDALPRGIDTVLGDGGSGLSGGQRQRIAIARAVLARPRLIVLDEPTAHVPQAIGVRIVENVRDLPWRPTVVVVTHDAAIAAGAGRILELRGGRGTSLATADGGLAAPADEASAAEVR